MYRLAVLMIVVLVGFGCDKEPEKAPGGDKRSINNSEGVPKDAPSNEYCESAHRDLEKMMQALRETLPENEKASVKTPEKANYLTHCKTLPTDLQKCLVVEYAQKNMKECSDIEKDLDPALAATFKKLISGE